VKVIEFSYVGILVTMGQIKAIRGAYLHLGGFCPVTYRAFRKDRHGSFNVVNEAELLQTICEKIDFFEFFSNA